MGGSCFAAFGGMQYLALLRYLQKNRRLVQNFNHFSEIILSNEKSFEGLCNYLRDEEPLFYKLLMNRKSEFDHEAEEISLQARLGVQFTYPGEKLYPTSFLHMPGAPLIFSFRGHPAWIHGRSIAVVGSRDASQLSHLWMEECFSEFLQAEQAVVVSGGARGIDQIAHRLALRNQSPTIVTLPSGLGAIYPSSLTAWQNPVVDGGGCFVSEYGFRQPMQKYFFHDRNRLIAGLGVLTLLVEARRRSGSLLTAQLTLQLGKNVLVIPGHPSEGSHLGNLDLLAEGATVVRDAQDLCTYFRGELNLLPSASPMDSRGC